MKNRKLNLILTSLTVLALVSQPVFAEDKVEEKSKDIEQNKIPDNIQNSSPFSQRNFIPDISFILDSSYLYRNLDNNIYSNLNVPGFTNFKDQEINGNNGFNLNYGELALASSVDPYFDLTGIFHFTLNGVEIDEAYINTRSLPFNLQLKAGKFLSNISKVSSQHPHYWDFADPPLVNKSFFGDEGLSEKGAQLTWLAPTDLYLLLGIEGLQGESENSFGTKGFKVGKTDLSEVNHPNTFTSFIKTSVDFDDFIILGGLSYLRGGTRIDNSIAENEADKANINGISGLTNIFTSELIVRYNIDSYRHISWQTEFLFRNTNGNKFTTADSLSYSRNQSGLYSQLIWRFDRNWKTGIRYDLLNKNDILENNQMINNPANLSRISAMLELVPTEYSRIRLQFNHNRAGYLESNQQIVNEVSLNLNMLTGAHGAHQL